MTGYAQVLHRLVWDIDPTDYRSLVSTMICGSTILGSILMLSLLSKFVVLLIVDAETWFLPPIVAVLAVVFGLRVHDARAHELPAIRPVRLLTPLLFPVYGLSTLKAAFECLLSWDGHWYQVGKTGR